MNTSLAAQALHLGGFTRMGPTKYEPLGRLPVALRMAVLETAMDFDPEAITVEILTHERAWGIEREEEPLSYAWPGWWQYHEEVTEEGLPVVERDHPFYTLFHRFPAIFSNWHPFALHFWAQYYPARDTFRLHIEGPEAGFVALVFLDALALIERTAAFTGVSLPEGGSIVLMLPSLTDLETHLLRVYGLETDHLMRVDMPRARVHVAIGTDAVEAHYRIHTQETDLHGIRLGDDRREWSWVETDIGLLSYFARRIFLVPELKDRQYDLLAHILQGHSTLGLLPTGYGKSLVYQLLSVLIPHPVFVISPLRSLIRDQLYNLERQGFRGATAVTVEDDSASRSEKYRRLREGQVGLFYVAPERLRMRDFYEEVQRNLKYTPVGAIVIDEVHCISEWGHDFRPAYLQVPRFRQAVEEATGRTVPIVGLTATASEPVRRDIQGLLGLKSEEVIQLASSDRPNLSLSVWKLEGPPSDARRSTLRQLLVRQIPELFHTSFSECYQPNRYHGYHQAGVIFTIYAAPEGRATFHEGVHVITYFLQREVFRDSSLVRAYASREPRRCPRCRQAVLIRSTEWYQGRKQSVYTCQACKWKGTGPHAQRDETWTLRVEQTQEDFQRNRFPLLVATKGYGMGIDKRNIRFIIHYTFASSLEAYYQEAGRAGRDGDHAHVALMYVPPTPECESTYLRKSDGLPVPPCVDNYYQCPMGLSGLCDYGHHAIMFARNYRSWEADLKKALNVYRELTTRPSLYVRGDEELKLTELALYRLQQLGIVREYYLQYEEGLSAARFFPGTSP